jgi:hypothetical protein
VTIINRPPNDDWTERSIFVNQLEGGVCTGVHRKIKENLETTNVAAELKAFQCQRRADVSGRQN